MSKSVLSQAKAELEKINAHFSVAIEHFRAAREHLLERLQSAADDCLKFINDRIEEYSLTIPKIDVFDEEEADLAFQKIIRSPEVASRGAIEAVCNSYSPLLRRWEACDRAYWDDETSMLYEGKERPARYFDKIHHRQITQWASRWRDRLRTHDNLDPVVSFFGAVDFHVYRAESEPDPYAELHDAFPELGYRGDPEPLAHNMSPERNSDIGRATIQEIGRANRKRLKEVIDSLTDAQRNLVVAYFIDGKSQVDIAFETRSTPPLVSEMISRIRKAFTDAGLPSPVRPIDKRRVHEIEANKLDFVGDEKKLRKNRQAPPKIRKSGPPL